MPPRSMIETGQIRRAILVAGENGAPLVEKTIQLLNEGDHTRKSIKPFFANLTIGASAVAWSIAHRDLVDKDCPSMGSWATETDTSYNELCQGDTSGDIIITSKKIVLLKSVFFDPINGVYVDVYQTQHGSIVDLNIE